MVNINACPNHEIQDQPALGQNLERRHLKPPPGHIANVLRRGVYWSALLYQR